MFNYLGSLAILSVKTHAMLYEFVSRNKGLRIGTIDVCNLEHTKGLAKSANPEFQTLCVNIKIKQKFYIYDNVFLIIWSYTAQNVFYNVLIFWVILNSHHHKCTILKFQHNNQYFIITAVTMPLFLKTSANQF